MLRYPRQGSGGTSARPLYVTAAGMPRADAASLVRHMSRPTPTARRPPPGWHLARHGLPEPLRC
jgi:hypothetical protein